MEAQIVETIESECENCRVITEQYAFIKEKLKEHSLTIDTLLSDRARSGEESLRNATVETAKFPHAENNTKDKPNDHTKLPWAELAQCHQMIRGLKMMINEKDAFIE